MHKDQQEQVNHLDQNNKNKTTLVTRRGGGGEVEGLGPLWPPAHGVHKGDNRRDSYRGRSQSPLKLWLPTMLVLLLLLISACAPLTGNSNAGSPTPGPKKTSQPGIIPSQTPNNTAADICPVDLNASPNCQTPHSMRVAYGVQSLVQRGFTGKGQTIVDIVSFGSPTLQADMDTFNRQFGLPPITIQVIAPLNEKPYDPNNDRGGWGLETELDVEIIHAIAPGAGIVVLVSPVAETEGTVGLPEFLQLEQYALAHHLGNIISQSWGASEVTLKDAAGQAEIQKWDAFYKQAATNGISIFSSSGDNGATDYTDLQASHLSPSPTTSFPADDPWVTSVGGTSLRRNGGTFSETAWNMSGGGFSSFFPEPSYQQMLPSSVQSEINHRRGVPDVSADANPSTGLAIYTSGHWDLGGGTSASAPVWAAILAIGDQMAGRSLGFINPTLYKLATTSSYTRDFHDITVGNNSINVGSVDVQGYPATQGWDPITGLGSPNVEKLLPDLIAATHG